MHSSIGHLASTVLGFCIVATSNGVLFRLRIFLLAMGQFPLYVPIHLRPASIAASEQGSAYKPFENPKVHSATSPNQENFI